MKLYPALSQDFNDLYRHMSDKDYIDILATPSVGTFKWIVDYQQLIQQMVFNSTLNCNMATIPRNTRININGYIFSLQYPINIIRYSNGALRDSL